MKDNNRQHDSTLGGAQDDEQVDNTSKSAEVDAVDSTGADTEDSTDTKKNLPRFMSHPTKVDILLWTLIIANSIYAFALMPFKGVLIAHHPVLYAVLTGGKLSMLAEGADGHSVIHNGVLVAIAAMSAMTTLGVFLAVGKVWGMEFVDYSFPHGMPGWYSKVISFYHKYPYVILAATFIPFSPLPATIVMIVAGSSAAKWWITALWTYIFVSCNKVFYVVLGHIFGKEVNDILVLIDKYVMYITIGLLVITLATPYFKKSRKKSSGTPA